MVYVKLSAAAKLALLNRHSYYIVAEPITRAAFLLLLKESKVATDRQLMTKTKDPPFLIGLQPKM